MGFGSILGVGSTLLGLAGGKDQKVVGQKDPFESLPELAQEAWLESVIPRARTESESARMATPMKRVSKPSTPFDSQKLYDLQQFSDTQGGLFSSLDPRKNRPGFSESSESSDINIDPSMMQVIGLLTSMTGFAAPQKQADIANRFLSDPESLQKLSEIVSKNPGMFRTGMDLVNAYSRGMRA